MKKYFAVILTTVFILFFSLYQVVSLKDYKHYNKIINSDVCSYYTYLPTYFIYKDPSLKYIDNLNEEVRSRIWFSNTETGTRVIKTSMGVATLYSPFFFMAHSLADDFGYLKSGYSGIYRIAIIFANLFYLTLGVFVLGLVLTRFYPVYISCITLLCIVLGTNMFNYVITEPGMSHVYSFFLFSCFIYCAICWHAKRSLFLALVIGIIFGLISLVRPTNALIILFLFLYEVKTIKGLRERIRLFWLTKSQWILAIFLSILVWVPQMLYWKTITGSYLYFSYGTKERFFFDNPHIIEGLFSFRKGWLIYSPIMIMAIIGLIIMLIKKHKLSLTLTSFMVINIYIIFSWWCWWYGGGFGSRPLIESYALLSLPFAFSLEMFLSTKYTRYLVLILIPSLVALNHFQIYQYRRNIIHWDSMSKKAYFTSFLKYERPENLNRLLEPINYDSAMVGKTITFPSFYLRDIQYWSVNNEKNVSEQWNCEGCTIFTAEEVLSIKLQDPTTINTIDFSVDHNDSYKFTFYLNNKEVGTYTYRNEKGGNGLVHGNTTFDSILANEIQVEGLGGDLYYSLGHLIINK